MWSFLKNFFSKKKDAAAGKGRGGMSDAEYDRQKKIATAGSVDKRMTLAQSTMTNKEILYYLAQHDPEAKVRKAVAANKASPVQIGPVLAGDVDVDVRMVLAKRLVDLLPELSKEEHTQLYAFAVQALGTLALDEVIKIRTALASTLKDSAYAPPKVVGKLAHDVEREVSEPILRFCVALSDDELLDILKQHPAEWAIEAIAGRNTVSEKVSKAVIDTDHRPAGQILLENEGATITESLLGEIVEKAKAYPEWQKSIATRKNLPSGVAKALAEFADASVRDVLMARDDFDKQTVNDISKVFKRRLEFAAEDTPANEKPLDRAKRLKKEGRLKPETISDAMAMQDRDFVYAALAILAKTDSKTVRKILDMKAPKPIISLCWKAGLPMRMALKVQQEMAHIPPQELIYPKGGTDYPLSKDEMLWNLDFVGVKA